MSLKGIDISQHQSTTPSLEGLAFIVLRASIATTLDTKYAQHYAAARKAGLVTMAYHFGYSEDQSPIAAQAETFLAAAADADFLWLDQEEQGFTDPQAQQFVDLIRAAGRPCGLYHSSSGFGGVNVDARWVADWRAESVTAGYPRTADNGRARPSTRTTRTPTAPSRPCSARATSPSWHMTSRSRRRTTPSPKSNG
jgi:hypothetical protein